MLQNEKNVKDMIDRIDRIKTYRYNILYIQESKILYGNSNRRN
jgi:hypothetical protein